MNDDLEIKTFMREKISGGMSLSDVQQEILTKFGKKLTYMQVRIMASELDNVDWSAFNPKKAEPEKTPEPRPETPAEQAVPESGADAAPAEADAAPKKPQGKTVVELSKVLRPGAVAGGTVKFASGSTAEWYLDQFGRLGLDKLNGAEPDENDVAGFQAELQKLFAR